MLTLNTRWWCLRFAAKASSRKTLAGLWLGALRHHVKADADDMLEAAGSAGYNLVRLYLDVVFDRRRAVTPGRGQLAATALRAMTCCLYWTRRLGSAFAGAGRSLIVSTLSSAFTYSPDRVQTT